MSPDIRNGLEKISTFFSKYHYTIFLAMSVLGIAIGIYSLLTVVQASSVTQDTDSQNSSAINEVTIQQIRNLDVSSKTDTELPKDQRINLFAE